MASAAATIRQVAQSVGLAKKTQSASEHFEAKVAEARASLLEAESAYRIAARVSITDPSPEHDDAAIAAAGAKAKAQTVLDGCEEALAEAQTAQGQARIAAERERVLAEDEAARRTIEANEEAIAALAAATQLFATRYAEARETEHKLVALFVDNARIRVRDDLGVSFNLNAATAAETARATPATQSGDVSNELASLPPGALAQGYPGDAGVARHEWRTLTQRATERADVLRSLLTVKSR